MIPITIGGNTYKSISEAWREHSPEGLPMITVRWRLKNGWDIEDAFRCPRVPATLRRSWREIRGEYPII